MPYDDAIRACQENRALLEADVKAGDLQAHALYNLSVALQDLAEALRDDLHDVPAIVEAVHALLQRQPPQTP